MTLLTQQEWNQIFVKVTKVHWDSLLRFASSLTADAVEAEDVLQTSLLKAVRFFPRFVEGNFSEAIGGNLPEFFLKDPGKNHLKNWMYKITRNTFLDMQSVQKTKTVDWDEIDEEYNVVSSPDRAQPAFFAKAAGQDASASHALEKEEDAFFALALDDTWREKILTLSAKQRSVLYLAAEEYSYKEIASILAIPIGTVMSTLSRAIEKLKKSAFSQGME